MLREKLKNKKHDIRKHVVEMALLIFFQGSSEVIA